MSYRKKHIKIKLKKLKPKKSFLKTKHFWLYSLLSLVLLIIIYVIFFSSIFAINKIIISGNNKITQEQILQISENNINKKIFSFGNWQIISKSVFLTNSQNIKQEILKTFPIIEDALVQKKLFKTLEIKIKERFAIAVFCKNNENNFNDCYYLDNLGIIFEKSENANNNFILYNSNQDNLIIGNKVVEQNIIEIILKVQKTLKENYNIDIINALVTTPFRLNIKTTENWQIYMATDADLNNQITKLNFLLKDEISPEARQKLQYIDLRFKDRAYYK